MKNKLISIILLLILIGTKSYAKDCFPQQSVSHSPDKKFSIFWNEPKENQSHHLSISNGRKKVDFYEFDRHVCVSWEPSAEHFALTDYTGSNISEAYVYSSNTATKLFDIIDIVPSHSRELFENNHHSYIEVTSWSPKGIIVHLWGYGDHDPNGFDEIVECSNIKKDWYCKKMGPTSHSSGRE